MALMPFPVPAGTETLDFTMAKPDGNGPFPAILLLPAIAGVNDYVNRRAEALRAQGYLTVVIDYFAREGRAPDVSTPQKIGAAVAGLSDPCVLGDVGATVAALRGRDDVIGSAIGALGFCIGGVYSFLSACEDFGIAASVDYYGMIAYAETGPNKPVSPLDKVPELKAPLLAHFGDFDRLISMDEIAAFAAALRDNQKNHEVCVYGGAPHAFDEDERAPIYRPVASGEAWARSLAFLNWHLRRIAPR
jgi:dienelactone hydrolase